VTRSELRQQVQANKEKLAVLHCSTCHLRFQQTHRTQRKCIAHRKSHQLERGAVTRAVKAIAAMEEQ